jgi:hypothetical protein
MENSNQKSDYDTNQRSHEGLFPVDLEGRWITGHSGTVEFATRLARFG